MVSALHHLINGKEGILQVDALVHGIVIRPGQTLRLLMVRAGPTGTRNCWPPANVSAPRTTKLYDRTSDQVSVDEIERIEI